MSELDRKGRLDSSAEFDQESTHHECDQQGRLMSELDRKGRLDSSAEFDQGSQLITSSTSGSAPERARPSGSTQGRAVTNGSARLFSFWDSAEFSRLSGLDSSGSPSPLQAGKTRLTAQPAASEAPAGSQGRGLATRGRRCAASELRAPPTDRVPNYDSVSTGIQPIPHGDRGATNTYDAHRPLTTRPPGVCLT
ncbi:unnamed protein product [Lampetra planeri]